LFARESFFHGTRVEKPCASATASRTRYQYSSRVPAHGAIASSSIEMSGSGITSSGSTSSRVPRPSQVGHAPYGELNEKFRGASSSKESPQNVHASDWENVWISSPSSVWTAIAAMPSASWSAVSMESATRRLRSGRATSRSTTTSIVCL